MKRLLGLSVRQGLGDRMNRVQELQKQVVTAYGEVPHDGLQ